MPTGGFYGSDAAFYMNSLVESATLLSQKVATNTATTAERRVFQERVLDNNEVFLRRVLGAIEAYTAAGDQEQAERLHRALLESGIQVQPGHLGAYHILPSARNVGGISAGTLAGRATIGESRSGGQTSITTGPGEGAGGPSQRGRGDTTRLPAAPAAVRPTAAIQGGRSVGAAQGATSAPGLVAFEVAPHRGQGPAEQGGQRGSPSGGRSRGPQQSGPGSGVGKEKPGGGQGGKRL